MEEEGTVGEGRERGTLCPCGGTWKKEWASSWVRGGIDPSLFLLFFFLPPRHSYAGRPLFSFGRRIEKEEGEMQTWEKRANYATQEERSLLHFLC